MKKGFGVLIAGCALLLVAVQPALGNKSVDVITETTVVITPTGTETATYSGTLATHPRKRGKEKKEKVRRRNRAKDCLEDREVEVWHGPITTGFLIGTAHTDVTGKWSLSGNKAPTGDTITVLVNRDEKGDAFCDPVVQVVASP